MNFQFFFIYQRGYKGAVKMDNQFRSNSINYELII